MNTLTIWRHCFACCLLLLLSISAFGAELRGDGVRATDSDTIVVKVGDEQHRIRLSGVDAPEAAHAFGKQACEPGRPGRRQGGCYRLVEG